MGKIVRAMIWLLFLLVLYISANVYVAYRAVYFHGIMKLFHSEDNHSVTSIDVGKRAITKSHSFNFTPAILEDQLMKIAKSKYIQYLEDEYPKPTNLSDRQTFIKGKISSRKEERGGTWDRRHTAVFTQTKSSSKEERESRKPDCHRLVSANDDEYEKEVNFVRSQNKGSKSSYSADWNILKMIQNCTTVKQYLGIYHPGHSSQNISVAYAILLDRSLEQTFKLLQNIYSPQSVYCLHMNMKAGKNYVKAFKMLAMCVENIVLPAERFRIGVQTVYKIHAQLACFRQLLNSSVRWSFLINLPGSAFPLRNQTMIEHYLKTKDHSNEISSRIPTTSRFFKRTRFEHVFQVVDGLNVYMRTKKRKAPPPAKVVLFRGEEYFIATRQFSHFATESSIAKEFLSWASDTKNPEEFFWASLHRYPGAPGGVSYRVEDEQYDMSPVGPESEDVADIPESDLLLTLWKSDGRHKCSGEYRGNLCVYGVADLRWIISQDKLFASSFDFKVDRTCIDCLVKHLRRPLVEDHIVDRTFDYPRIL